MLRGDLRDGGVLTRTELRAMVRRATDSKRRIAAIGIGLLQFAVVFPLFGYGPITAVGRQLAHGEAPIGLLGAVCTSGLVTGLYIGSMSAINQDRIGSVGPLVRTSIPPRAVAVGRMGSELVQTAALFAPPIVSVLLILSVGAGSPLPSVLLGLGVVIPLLTGIFAGRTIGATARYAGLLARLSTWTKVLAFVLVMVLIFLGSQVAVRAFLPSDASFGMSVGLPAFLPGAPMQAYAAVILSPLGGTVSPLGVLILALALASIPGGLAAAIRVEAAMLLTQDEDGTETEQVEETRAIPFPFAAFPSTRMGFRHLLRTVRDPKSLAHLFPLLFGGLAVGASWIPQPELALSMGPPTAVVTGAVVAGVAYCLNPMGDDREQLSLILSSVDSTGVLLRGRVVAGSTLGLLLAVGVGTPLSLLGTDPLYTVGQTLLAPRVVAVAASTALGLGALVPKFERREYVNVERAHPSQMALFGFLFGCILLFGAGLFLLWWTLNRGEPPIAIGAWIVYLGLLGALGVGGYVYAVRTFDALTLDDV